VTYSIVRRRVARGSFSPPLDVHCPACGRRAVVMLPRHLVAIQPDETNAVCLHLIGGCDQGFAIDVDALAEWLHGDTVVDP